MYIDYKLLGKVRPTVEGDWDIKKEYKLLSIVFDADSNKSYISKKDVPIGISILNKEYWGRFSNNRIDSDSIIILSHKNSLGQINSYTLEEAIATISDDDKRIGMFISFYEKSISADGDYRWNMYQFNSDNVGDWNNVNYWSSIYYIKTKFFGLQETEEALYGVRINPDIGDYAFVGMTLKDAVIYRCRTKNVWTKTEESAIDYITVMLKGNITVGSNGNWFENGVDTGIKAQGPKGDKGDSIKGDKGDTPVMRLDKPSGYVQYGYDGIHWENLVPLTEFVINNNPDNEDIAADENNKLQFADKSYNAAQFSGLGRKYLRKNIQEGKNILTQDMINQENTIYIIQYDYDLNGVEITIPANCVLQFEGGSLNNGTILGDSTSLISNFKGNVIIKNILKNNYNILNDSDFITNWVSVNSISKSTNYIADGKSANRVFDFKEISLNIENNDIGNRFKFSDYENITIKNLNIKGDTIELNGKIINTDLEKKNIIIDKCKNVLIENCIIENARGDSLYISNCENLIIRNCYIYKSTLNLIRTSIVKNVSIYNNILIGVGDRGNTTDNDNIGGGISINVGDNATIKNNYIKDVCDSGIQVNGYIQASVENNTIINFGKDGVKIMQSPTFFQYGDCLYGNISNNYISSKFEGQTDGSAYIIMSNTIYGIIENNITIGGENPKDDYYFNWASIIATVGKTDSNLYKIVIKNNKLHNSINLFNYHYMNILNNDTNYILLQELSTEGHPNNIKEIKINNNNIQAIKNKTLPYSIKLDLHFYKISIINNTIINPNGSIFGITKSNDNCFIEVNNNNIEYLTSFIAIKEQEHKINNFIILNNNGIILNTSERNTYLCSINKSIIDKVEINNNNIKENTKTNITTFLLLDSTSSINILTLTDTNYINNSNIFQNKDSLKDKVKRLIGNPILTSFDDNIFQPSEVKSGDCYRYYLGNDLINIIYDGTKYYSNSIMFNSSNKFILDNIRQFKNNKIQQYINGKWINVDGLSVDTKYSGTFTEKPLASSGIPNGFAYFCTDKQTTEGQANGIMIYHKGSNVWVDALGRTIS